MRSVAAPIVFVLRPEGLEWWQQGEKPRRIGPVVPPGDVPNFFVRHQNDFSPDAVYRAKTWGRFDNQYQLSFVDLGLMPMVESEIGGRLQDLISSNVQGLKSLLAWDTLSVEQGAWLLKSVFWIVSAKILRDKSVGKFKTADLTDVEQILDSVGEHFGAERIAVKNKKQREALREIANRISQFSSLELVTTESLAHVYENTLISKATRQALGTHSTPSYLVDYIVGRLKPWIQEIDLADRNVFEPACGHSAFLVSAMRLLTELHPDGQTAQKRRSYLRTRIHGCEMDAFALEIARLSLSLTDIPNPNGWDLNLGDMFEGDTLETMASKATILLANPPFENFKGEEKDWYSKRNVTLHHVNKTTEMLSRVLPALPDGAVIGLVVPQGFLHSKNATSVRKLLTTEFELQEICLFPDKVFTFADSESAALIARKAIARTSSMVRFRRVRERDMQEFQARYEVSIEISVPQQRFQATNEAGLRVADLEPLWQFCSRHRMLTEFAQVGQGFTHKGETLPVGSITQLRKQFPNAVKGFARFEGKLMTHDCPIETWLNIGPEVVRRPGHGTTTGIPQVIFNEAPCSRGPWRLKAMIDHLGHAVTGRFNVVRPTAPAFTSLEALWAIFNSPIANAFAYAHSGKRHNDAGMFRQMPIPELTQQSTNRIEEAGRAYLDCVTPDPDSVFAKANFKTARELLLRVDCEVLKLYDLPRELERQLLDYFAGWQREGVPFKFDRYFPEHFTDPISLADYLAITADWPETNRRRAELIRKKVARTISSNERTELNHLQSLATSRANLIAPLPLAELERLHREVVGGTE